MIKYIDIAKKTNERVTSSSALNKYQQEPSAQPKRRNQQSTRSPELKRMRKQTAEELVGICR